jgi:hypothetical protein
MEPGSFEVGDTVELSRSNKEEFKGRTGCIECFSSDDSKCTVQLFDGNEESVIVSCRRLEKVKVVIDPSSGFVYVFDETAAEWMLMYIEKSLTVGKTSDWNENESLDDLESVYARLKAAARCFAPGCNGLCFADALCQKHNNQIKRMLRSGSLEKLLEVRKMRRDAEQQARNVARGDNNKAMSLYKTCADRSLPQYQLISHKVDGFIVLPQKNTDIESYLEELARVQGYPNVTAFLRYVTNNLGFVMHLQSRQHYYDPSGKLLTGVTGHEGVAFTRGTSFRVGEEPDTHNSEATLEYERKRWADHKKRRTSEEAKECGGNVVFTDSQEKAIALVREFAAEKGGSSNKPIALPVKDSTPRSKKVRVFYDHQLRNVKEDATCSEKTKKKAKYILNLYKTLGFNV